MMGGVGKRVWKAGRGKKVRKDKLWLRVRVFAKETWNKCALEEHFVFCTVYTNLIGL